MSGFFIHFLMKLQNTYKFSKKLPKLSNFIFKKEIFEYFKTTFSEKVLK